MMPTSRHLILIGLLGLVSLKAFAQSPALPSRLAAELADLRAATTLASWKSAHPDDITVAYSHRQQDWGNWIARAETRARLSDSREIIRRAYFYAPDPPESLTFPRKARPHSLVKEAQLGFIWIESSEAVKESGAALAENVRQELSEHFGSGQYDSKIWFANAAYWSRPARWQVGAATFVSAYQWIDQLPDRDRVLAFGYLPISGLHVDLGGGEDSYEDCFQTELRALDAAIAASGLAGKDLQPIIWLKQRIAEHHSAISPERPATLLNEVLDALKDWLMQARNRGRRQNAAALLAADTALGLLRQLMLVNADDEATRNRLKSLDADFVDVQLDGFVYTHGWLKKALRLDRQGTIGDLARISMMEKGFNLDAACAGVGYEGFRRVISAGERFLSKSTNGKLRAQVHLLVARAYSDLVALADGAGEGYVPAANYQREAAWARAKAIAHYRQSMNWSDDSREAMRIWKAAWRLRAGIAPTQTNFLCVYD